MNTKHSIEELNQILKDLYRLKEQAEAIFQRLDSEVEKMSDEMRETDYGTTLEDARDELESSLWNGFEIACDGIYDTISNLTLLKISSKTTQEVDVYLDLSDEEESLNSWGMDAGISSVALGHHWAQSNQYSCKNDSTGTSRNGYNPFDTHGESSFDWVDEDGDGYDDRDDGFWTEKEF